LFTLFLLFYVYGGDDYLVNLKVVSKTTKCHDFTVILPVFFSKMHRDFADFYRDFLTALPIMSCFIKIQNGLSLCCRLTLLVMEKWPLNT